MLLKCVFLIINLNLILHSNMKLNFISIIIILLIIICSVEARKKKLTPKAL